jgi:hypothetical protein
MRHGLKMQLTSVRLLERIAPVDLRQTIIMASGAALILVGLILIIFQMIRENRGGRNGKNKGTEVRDSFAPDRPQAQVRTNYVGVGMILIGTMLEIIGVFAFK